MRSMDTLQAPPDDTFERALEEANLAQADLARALDCSPVMVNRWVRAGVVPARPYRKQIIKELAKHGVTRTIEDLWA